MHESAPEGWTEAFEEKETSSIIKWFSKGLSKAAPLVTGGWLDELMTLMIEVNTAFGKAEDKPKEGYTAFGKKARGRQTGRFRLPKSPLLFRVEEIQLHASRQCRIPIPRTVSDALDLQHPRK